MRSCSLVIRRHPSKVILRSDSESSSAALKGAVQASRDLGLGVEVSSAGDSQAKGGVERAMGTVRGHIPM
eukprot:8250167-Pyramimonas_sp.AAC.1